MLKKVVKYTDFEDVERSDTVYFNLTKAEMMEFALDYPNGLEDELNHMAETNDKRAIYVLIKKLILKSYGEKNPEGKFVKTDSMSEIFSHTELYSQLIDDITVSAKESIIFFNSVLSQKIRLEDPGSLV